MPIHDWTRVRANRFHHFHQTWTANLAAALNAGRLPTGFFAMTEQITGGPEADVVTLELAPKPGSPASGGLHVETAPPKARIVSRTEAARYARKANRITIRYPDGDVIAVIELFRQETKTAPMPSARLRARRSNSFTPEFIC